MLKFIGSGSAFNTKLGNNSAYYKEGSQMLLIDCGSNIFHRIKENKLLEGVEKINVIITHCHADHVGSLADLILYTYYSHGEFAKSKVHVISPFDTKVDKLLKINGCTEGEHFTINLLGGTELVAIDELKIRFTFHRTNHVKEIPSYRVGLLFEDGTDVFYSGDATGTYFENKEQLNGRLNFFDILYVDTCKADYKGNVHLSLRELTEMIPEEYRHKFWCMHLDEGFDRKEAEELGFNVVVNEF